jgi:hypothetical protein
MFTVVNIGGTMTKDEARNLFGPAYADLARGVGMTRAAISRWPDVLLPWQADLVIGAAVRLGRALPADVVQSIACAALVRTAAAKGSDAPN